jgi:ABC-type transporter Mla subunit MlaD
MSDLQKFNQTLEDFSQEVEQLKDVSGAYKKLERLTETYSEISKQFAENSKTLGAINELQKAQQEKLAKSLVELGKLIEEKTDQIRRENKEFYKDFESTLKIKLDENKSQIKQLIENERNQIKQIFEIEFAKNTKELKQVIETETSKQTQLLASNQKTIKILLWIFGGLTVILSALAVLKLWVM